MKLSMGKRDLDPLGVKSILDLRKDFVARWKPQVQAGQEDSNLDGQLTIGHDFEEGGWLGIFEHVGMGLTNLLEDLACSRHVGTVGNTNVDHHAIGGIGQSPVEQSSGDEIFVGDNQFLLVEIHDRCGSHANLGYGSGGIADGDDIADANRLLEEQDQTGYEIGENFLEPEAETNPQRSDEPLDAGPPNA